MAIISFLVEQMRTNGHDSLRILVAAHTNAAVDRVLVGLLDRGFTGATCHLVAADTCLLIPAPTQMTVLLR